ncbi:MAG TPA: hypothetical protein VHG28_17255 [Longimicrobiaceae bacterium]|nr:hypothetical protein [Longimicrobiaceae bacterium]
MDELNRERLDASIELGLDFLDRAQLASGEFRVFMSTDHSFHKDRVADSTPFATALVAYSLGFAGSARASRMLERAARFLRAEMEGPGAWRYWTKQHRYHSTIPPDLDDITCASCVLRRQGVAFPPNRELILANRDRRGLFYTWVVPRWPLPRNLDFWRVALRHWANPVKAYYFWRLNESAPSDVDGVVNANVLFYLGDGEAAGPVADYLMDIARSGREDACDKWHLNRYTFYYAVSRCFHAGISGLGAIREAAVRRIVEGAREDGAIGGSALDTALAACALLYWGSSPPELERALRFLLAAQGPSGEWPAVAMYYGGPRKYYGWGSEELTTGFCIEALSHYLRSHRSEPASRSALCPGI